MAARLGRPGCEEFARWWRATLRYRGRIVEQRTFADDATIRVGPGNADFVLPGLSAPTAVVCGHTARLGNGLEGVSYRQCETPIELGHDARPVGVGDTLRLWPSQHPDVEVELVYERGRRWSSRGRLGLPWRELAYGVTMAGCILALLAVSQRVGAVESGGEASDDGPIARAMMTSTPAAIERSEWTGATVGFASPEPPTVELDAATPNDPVDVDVLPVQVAIGQRAVSVAAVHETGSRKRSRPSEHQTAKRSSEPGQHSHSKAGQIEPGGPGDGPAAAADPFVCDDPESEPKPQVDVVFVIDVSTTMKFMLRHLSEEIAAVDAAVRRHDPEPRYGLAIFVDDVMLVNDGEPYEDADALRRDFERWAAFASTNRQIHASAQNLDWPENGLDALHAAATGFRWRSVDDTLRLVVHATDDDFGAGGQELSGGTVEHGYVETVDALQKAGVRVASFAARIGGKCECKNVGAGYFSKYQGYPSIPAATGGAVFDIDEVASGRLHLSDAFGALVANTVCERSVP